MPIIRRFPIISERTLVELPAFSEAARAQAFARLAAKRIAQTDAENAAAAGRRLPYDLVVDGARAATFSSVKASSIVVARWSVGYAAVDFIFETLRNAGPRLSGAYRDSMRMYVDGVASLDPRDAVGAREALFVPTVPYARKIERGAKGYAPGHVYQAVAQAAAARFGDAARIKFTYAEPEETTTALHKWAAGKGVSLRRRSGSVKMLRQPAILVLLR
ncbi:hypothetical protein [Methylocystis parvus]|uniref:hypothetical protein n=1 Tax=Methylocystis parvus TaxID=134 RepID=UPI003C778D99